MRIAELTDHSANRVSLTDSAYILLVAPSGSYRIAPYIRAARSLGYRILVVSNSAHSLTAEIAQGINVDFDNPRAALQIILDATKGLNLLCVLATDDSCVSLSSEISAHLKLPHNSAKAAELTHRKDLARKALREAECNIPGFELIDLKDNRQNPPGINFPLVLKPLSLSASRGVIRANNLEEYYAACSRIDSILQSSGQTGYPRQHILVESYLDGEEFAVEGFVVSGEFYLLAIFDKPEPLTGPFFEETYYITPTRLSHSQQQRIIDEVKKCCHAYELIQGPVHAELRLTADGPVLLELAARTIGGQCGQLIEFSLGKKLEEIVIEGMCGIAPETTQNTLSAGVLMIPIKNSGILKRVEGMTKALQVEFIVDIEIHIREGYELIPLPEGASYLGFIFARAPNFEQVYSALKQAYRSLDFITQKAWKLELNRI